MSQRLTDTRWAWCASTGFMALFFPPQFPWLSFVIPDYPTSPVGGKRRDGICIVTRKQQAIRWYILYRHVDVLNQNGIDAALAHSTEDDRRFH